MANPSTRQSARKYPSLLILCMLLWIFSLLVSGFAIWFFINNAVVYGSLALVVAALLAGAGTGLYRLRRWGVIFFGVLAGLGSINHLAGTMQRYSTISTSDPLSVLAALVGILSAIVLPVLFAYLILILWRRMS